MLPKVNFICAAHREGIEKQFEVSVILVDEKLEGLKNTIKVGFAVGTAVLAIFDFILNFNPTQTPVKQR